MYCIAYQGTSEDKFAKKTKRSKAEQSKPRKCNSSDAEAIQGKYCGPYWVKSAKHLLCNLATFGELALSTLGQENVSAHKPITGNPGRNGDTDIYRVCNRIDTRVRMRSIVQNKQTNIYLLMHIHQ